MGVTTSSNVALTYEPIATQTVSASNVTITFTSIPSTYTDLVLVTGSSNTLGGVYNLRFNNDSGSNYSYTVFSGNGSATACTNYVSQTSTNLFNIPGSGSIQMTTITHLMNYANTSVYKSLFTRANDTSGLVNETAGFWLNTSAINRIDLSTSGASNFINGSVITLYGILKG